MFLTGKAGTGKTTFLTNFIATTKKKYIVVAPTGIAAINAGGVTIHSMFGLPLTTFVPTYDEVDRNEAINITQLLPHFKYRRQKLKLLRALEILIIDEVSMLRCDVLDMIDLALRAARRSQQRFGGVQLLLVGDLYQLPPVVTQSNESILYRYYSSPFFFDATAAKEIALLTVELKKIYRQTDAVFVSLLNAIRDNDLENINFELLNARYNAAFSEQDSYVYLVSHNYMALNINRQRLDALPGKPFVYKALISGDFRQHLYPNDEELLLKPGAQVMFIRNDGSEAKRFFNGKLAVITQLDEDSIKVLPEGETDEMTIEREVWENKTYHLDDKKHIKEDIIGRYEQFPFRLAWAVTIHKSQGLTFDKVIIDAGKSFTSGQVYVALSRCRTLQGIVLKSRISAHAILSDHRIAAFEKQTEAGEKVETILADEKFNYAISKIVSKLDVHWLLEELATWETAVKESRFLAGADDEKIVTIKKEAEQLQGVFQKFERYITTKTGEFTKTNTGWQLIEEKCAGAVNFFLEKIYGNILQPLTNLYAKSKAQRGLKGYNDVLKSLLEFLEEYIAGLKEAYLFDKKLCTNNTRVSDVIKIQKVPSHVITYQMLDNGKTPAEIATERGIALSTVQGHMARIAATGILDIDKIFDKKMIDAFKEKFDAHNFESLYDWKNVLPHEIDYNDIRILLNHFKYQKSKKIV